MEMEMILFPRKKTNISSRFLFEFFFPMHNLDLFFFWIGEDLTTTSFLTGNKTLHRDQKGEPEWQRERIGSTIRDVT